MNDLAFNFQPIRRNITFFLILLFAANSLSAQYFGKNKPRYKTFDFGIQSSEHFDIYHYLKNDELLDDINRKAEQWHIMHQAVLQDTLKSRNPIVLYNNHQDFQQTNTISSTIGVGTGGVTEAFQNRVIFPITFTNEQTNHVLGHEMVHAFQYNMIINGDSLGINNLKNLPLWMIEGLAEYLSKGKNDPFTAMWMRSSVANDDIPTFKDLQNPQYFPYRYGQSFWAFISSKYGDEAIRPLFLNTAKYGFEVALKLTLETTTEELEKSWESALKSKYQPYLVGRTNPIGKDLLTDENSGELNVSPSLSPNGKYVAFWSEKDVLGTNMYLAEATNGKIIRKITDVVRDGHLDAINFLEASGTWSNDSKKFAFVGIKKGRNVIVIKDVESGKTLEEIIIKKVPSFTHLAWNPNGKSIVFTGLVQGQTDLYEYTFKDKSLRQLTNNPYSEIMANFNADGTKLTYSTDYKSYFNGRTNGHYTFDIAIMDMASLKVDVLDIFYTADNLNPNWDHEGNIYFLSNRDGHRNIYKYYPNGEKLEQITNLKIGVSGITDYSPALSVSTRRDRIVYSAFDDFKYSISKINYSKVTPIPVSADDVDMSPGFLPYENGEVTDAVNANISKQDQILNTLGNIEMIDKPYKPKFSLDFVGGGAGVGANTGQFGNSVGLAGGIQLLFNDQLGNNQIFSNISVNGDIADAGGQVSYLNRKHRIAWGIGLSHIPQRTGYSRINPELVDLKLNNGQTIKAIEQNLNIIRIFNQDLTLFAHLPFSTILRLEGGITGGYQSFRQDLYQNYYQNIPGTPYIGQERERIPTGDQLQIDNFYTIEKGFQSSANIALVGDNSVFGLTSPLKGHRFRLGIEQHFGINNYTAVIGDARKYFWLKPFSFAVRGMTYSRLDNSEGNNVYPFYIGSQGFVRGYGSVFSGINNVITRLEGQDVAFGQLLGSNLGLVSGEIRLPFTGPKKLSLIASRFLLSDLALFYDTGVAFNRFSDFSANRKPYLAVSTGVSARINLFGALIVEPYYAYLVKENTSTFGINLTPGW